MARESRSASSSAASALGKGHMRQPPAAGPRAVECTAMMHLRPDFSSEKAWTPSWPSKAGESNKVMPRTSLMLGEDLRAQPLRRTAHGNNPDQDPAATCCAGLAGPGAVGILGAPD